MKKQFLYKLIFTMFLVFALGGIFALISPASTHAAALVNPYPGTTPPDCNSTHPESYTNSTFYFRTQVSCTLQVSKITSTAFAQFATYKDTSYTTISGSTVRNNCSNCTGLLNPKSGGLVAINISNNPPGSYRVYETISWTYTDRGGTHTKSKNIIG